MYLGRNGFLPSKTIWRSLRVSRGAEARLLASLRAAEAEERAGAALALRAHEDARAVPAAPAEM